MNTIVIGNNHNNTLGLVWSLGEAGHRITLLLYNSANNYVSASKYIWKTYLVQSNDDIIALLKNVARDMDSKPVVFVSNDVDATLLNEHYRELASYCFFEGGRADGGINRYRDKEVEEELALKCGFTIPQTEVIKQPRELIGVSLKYPLLIKANNSVRGWKSAMKKCDTKLEAESFVNSLSPDLYPLQVQEFIEKEYEIMLLGCSLFGGKRVICPVANKKIRQYPPNTGAGTWSVSTEVAASEELRQLAGKVANYLKEIEYTGNFSAEFLYSGGKFYFLEINLRNDGTSWLSTCSGYNLPDMVCRSFVDEIVSSEGCMFQKMYYMNIIGDLNYVRNGSISWFNWMRQFKRDTCYSHYNKRDRKPFWKFVKPMLTAYFHRHFK